MWEILSYDSIGCKQALPIFEELVKAGQEPVGEDYPATESEHRLAEWLEHHAAAPDTPPVKPQSPRQPIYLSVKRKASEQPEKPEKPEPEVTTFLLAARGGFHEEQGRHSSNHVLVPCEGDDKYQGKGCAWMAWRLVGQAQPPDVGHHVVLRPERRAGLLPQAHHEAAAPPSGVHPPLQAWQGEASRCREADGQLLGAEGDHAGHESGRVRRPCCSKRTSGARVLPTTGFEELRRLTTSEFQSHLIKLDTTFRGDKALNTGKRRAGPPGKLPGSHGSRVVLQRVAQLCFGQDGLS